MKIFLFILFFSLVPKISFSADLCDKSFITKNQFSYTEKGRIFTPILKAHLGHSTQIIDVIKFSPDSNYIISKGWDEAILWDVVTGYPLKYFRSMFGTTSFEISPDNRWAWAIKSDKGILLDLDSGKTVCSVTRPESRFLSFGFSSDSHTLLITHDKGVEFWSVRTREMIKRISFKYLPLQAFAISRNNRLLFTVHLGEARLWDVEYDRLIWARKTSIKENFLKAMFYQNDQEILTGHPSGIYRWNVTTGEMEKILSIGGTSSLDFSIDGQWAVRHKRYSGYRLIPLHEEGMPINLYSNDPISVSPDGRWIMHVESRESKGTLVLKNAHTGRDEKRFLGQEDRVTSLAVAPGELKIFLVLESGKIAFFNMTDNPTLKTITDVEKNSQSFLSITSSGRLFFAGDSRWDEEDYIEDAADIDWAIDYSRTIFELTDNGFLEERAFIPLENEMESLYVSDDNQWALVGEYVDGKIHSSLWKLSGKDSWKPIWKVQGNPLGFSPDGKHILLRKGKHFFTREVISGKEIGRFDSVGEAYSSNRHGKFIFLKNFDGGVSIMDTQTGLEIGQLFFFKDNKWCFIDSDGRFDGSNGGDVKGLHWVVGTESVELYQLKERYYEPGLLAKILGFNNEQLRDVSAFTDVALYPAIHLEEPTAEVPTLGIAITNRGGGIGKVIVSINGKEVTADARERNADPDSESLAVTMDLTTHPYLIPGQENTIEVRAFNAEGYLSSRGVRTVFQPPGVALRATPTLWAIVAGVSDYAGDKLDLQYAEKDAVDIGHALQLGATQLFGIERVHLSLLTTAEGAKSKLPTKANLLQSFQAIAKSAKSTDILVVYLAGHGVTHGGPEGDFYYLTSSAKNEQLTDPEIRKQDALSSAELTELIQGVAALKQVLILDTCGAGRVVEQWTKKRALEASQVRAFERMKDRMGLFVLAGSAADAVSYEASRYGQGLLTYSLLLGMRGAALREGHYIDVNSLFSHAVDRVPELAQDIGGIQLPVVAIPRAGRSFDIGRLTDQEKSQINIGTPRPMFVRTSFVDAQRIRDHLKLGVLVNEQLRMLSAPSHEAPILFLDAPSFPGSHTLSGIYKVSDSRISVTVLLSTGEQDLERFTVEGITAQVDELAQRIVEKAKSQLNE